MNRYLLTALYVMAGCAVTIPIKALASGEPLRGERCRLVITNTVKVVSVYIEQNEDEQIFHDSLPPDYIHFPESEVRLTDFSGSVTVFSNDGLFCHSSHRIRAPENWNKKHR